MSLFLWSAMEADSRSDHALRAVAGVHVQKWRKAPRAFCSGPCVPGIRFRGCVQSGRFLRR